MLPHTHDRVPARRAFTLIELLIVVSIITLLLAILLPSLSSARQQARNANCLYNLKGQGIATQFYLTSNREYFPYRDSTSSPGGGSVWAAFKPTRTILKEDRRALEIFACPADAWEGRIYELGTDAGPAPAGGSTEADRLGIANYYKLPVDFKVRWSYALNNMTGIRPVDASLNPLLAAQERLLFSQRAAAYRNTTKTLLYADCTWINARGHKSLVNDTPALKGRVANGNAPSRFATTPFDLPDYDRPRQSARRHPSGSNVVFFDQHAETVSQKALFAPSTVLYSWSESFNPAGQYPPGVIDPATLPELP